jgi:hypothetical protein
MYAGIPLAFLTLVPLVVFLLLSDENAEPKFKLILFEDDNYDSLKNSEGGGQFTTQVYYLWVKARSLP